MLQSYLMTKKYKVKKKITKWKKIILRIGDGVRKRIFIYIVHKSINWHASWKRNLAVTTKIKNTFDLSILRLFPKAIIILITKANVFKEFMSSRWFTCIHYIDLFNIQESAVEVGTNIVPMTHQPWSSTNAPNFWIC